MHRPQLGGLNGHLGMGQVFTQVLFATKLIIVVGLYTYHYKLFQ